MLTQERRLGIASLRAARPCDDADGRAIGELLEEIDRLTLELVAAKVETGRQQDNAMQAVTHAAECQEETNGLRIDLAMAVERAEQLQLELAAARNLNTIYSSDIYTAMRERAEQAEMKLAVEQEANRNNVAMHCQQIADLTRDQDEARAACAAVQAWAKSSLISPLHRGQYHWFACEICEATAATADAITHKTGCMLGTNPGQPLLDELENACAWKKAMKETIDEVLKTATELTYCESNECGGCDTDESPPCEGLARWLAHALENVEANKQYDELARLRRLAAALGNKLLAERIIGVHDEPHYPEYCRACADNELLANFVQAVREAAKAANPTGKDSEA